MFTPTSAGACALPPENKQTGSMSMGPSAFAPLIVMINWLEGERFKDAAASGEGAGTTAATCPIVLFCLFVYGLSCGSYFFSVRFGEPCFMRASRLSYECITLF